MSALVTVVVCTYNRAANLDEALSALSVDVLGQKITAIRDKHFRKLRVGIAHALLDTGEITVILDKMEYVQEVNKWLPLCHICARWMLLNDFPRECSLAMK